MIDQKIKIMEIERFAIHDGPGIRSVVFFQGCPLHCPWCANPESQKIVDHLFHSKSKCTSCGYCIAHCPHHALQMENDRIVCKADRCIRCGKCEKNCLQSALKWVGNECSVGEIIKELERDDAYYQKSQGGITLSGGEVFVQFKGLKSLLSELKKRNYHVCIETCGEFKTELLDEVLDLVDLFLFDLKHSDENQLHDVTGGHLDLIKNNIQRIATYDPKRIQIRVPVIPGFNDQIEVIEQIAKFAAEQKIESVQLLPFHNLAKSKYEQMGLEYAYGNVPNMKKEHLEEYRNCIEKYKVKAII